MTTWGKNKCYGSLNELLSQSPETRAECSQKIWSLFHWPANEYRASFNYLFFPLHLLAPFVFKSSIRAIERVVRGPHTSVMVQIDKLAVSVCMPSASCTLCMLNDRQPSSPDQFTIYHLVSFTIWPQTWATIPCLVNMCCCSGVNSGTTHGVLALPGLSGLLLTCPLQCSFGVLCLFCMSLCDAQG